MRINQDKVKERLEGVPQNKRSHIYDASIVLEFLAQTFIPTRFFLPEGFTPTPGTLLGQKSMRKVSEGNEMSIGDLYELYQLWREEKDYTARIESRYIFGIIVRNLRYYRNGWEFTSWRVGTAQIWHMGPLKLRKDLPADVRAKFPARVEDHSIEGSTIEADPVSEPEENTSEDQLIADRLKNGMTTHYTGGMVEAAPDWQPTEEEADAMCLRPYGNLCGGDHCNGSCQVSGNPPDEEY